MWSVMQLAARFQQGIDQLRNDAQEIARDVSHFFGSMSDETRILFFIMFILTIFYMIVRRPSDTKESGGMGRQFVFALAIVLIFSYGISVALDHNGLDKITRV